MIVNRLDLLLLHVAPQVAQALLAALLTARHIVLTAGCVLLGKLSRIRLRLLLLESKLLKHKHLALLVSGELLVLLAVQCGEGGRGRRDRLDIGYATVVEQAGAVMVQDVGRDARVESGVVRCSSLGQLVQLVVLLRMDALMLFQVLRTLERLAADRARVGL